MRSIVVAVNFTHKSANATRYAADLALAIGAGIHLINSYPVPAIIPEIPIPETRNEKLRNSCFGLLGNLSAAIIHQTDGKVPVTTEIMTDHVDVQLEQYCSKYKPLLVLIGASGDSLQNMLVGSRTVKALHRLGYPFLTIPDRVRFRPVQKIVLACDKEDMVNGMPAMLPALKEFSELLGATLQVVRVLKYGEIPIPDPEINFVRALSVPEGIATYLDDHPADWLVVFLKNHSFLEFHRSRSKQIVLYYTLPVVVQ